MAKLDDLKAAISELENDVQAQTTVVQSAVTLLEGLSAQLRDVVTEATDLDDIRQRLQNLNATLDIERDKLAAAVVANTPGAEQPPQPTPPSPPVAPVVPVPEPVPEPEVREVVEGESFGLPEDFGRRGRG